MTITADDITTADIQTCGKDRQNLAMASIKLSTLYNQIITGTSPSGGGSSGKKGSSSSKTSSTSTASSSAAKASSTSTTPTVSESAVAQAKASVLQAQQSVDSATANLDSASLTAPIDGTVAAVTLTKGGSSSAGGVTIVGAGKAVVTFQLPLATRKLVSVGHKATLVPAGSLTTLTGTITRISTVETSGSAGSSPTYTTTIEASDQAGLLADGSRATVRLDVATATNVVRVPVSAVTPTAGGMGTVMIVDGTAATQTQTAIVSLGAVGGGYVEVKSGLPAGQLVVLADTTAPLPANGSNTRNNAQGNRTQSGVAIGG